jgi:hypothetical protein
MASNPARSNRRQSNNKHSHYPVKIEVLPIGRMPCDKLNYAFMRNIEKKILILRYSQTFQHSKITWSPISFA